MTLLKRIYLWRKSWFGGGKPPRQDRRDDKKGGGPPDAIYPLW